MSEGAGDGFLKTATSGLVSQAACGLLLMCHPGNKSPSPKLQRGHTHLYGLVAGGGRRVIAAGGSHLVQEVAARRRCVNRGGKRGAELAPQRALVVHDAGAHGGSGARLVAGRWRGAPAVGGGRGEMQQLLLQRRARRAVQPRRVDAVNGCLTPLKGGLTGLLRACGGVTAAPVPGERRSPFKAQMVIWQRAAAGSQALKHRDLLWHSQQSPTSLKRTRRHAKRHPSAVSAPLPAQRRSRAAATGSSAQGSSRLGQCQRRVT